MWVVPQAFHEHIRNSTPWILGLLDDETHHMTPIALLLVETYFRPGWIRWIEYAVWMLLWLLRHPYRHKMTIGMAQIQHEEWRRLGVTNRPWDYENAFANHAACKGWLTIRGLAPSSSVSEVTRIYTGSTNPFYQALLNEAKSQVRRMAVARFNYYANLPNADIPPEAELSNRRQQSVK